MTAFRDTVMAALLAKLQADCGSTFQTYSRRFLTWEDLVNTAQGQALLQPALFLFDGVGLGGGRERFEQRGRGRPVVSVLDRTVVIYAKLPGGGTPSGPDHTTPGGQVFHPLEESVLSSFNNFDDRSANTLTLGGLVSHCWIEGDALMVTGEVDTGEGQGMLTIPVHIMLLPNAQ